MHDRVSFSLLILSSDSVSIQCLFGSFGGMSSAETPPPSLRRGVRIVPPDSSVTVEEVQVGHDNLLFASRMNKAVVFFFFFLIGAAGSPTD